MRVLRLIAVCFLLLIVPEVSGQPEPTLHARLLQASQNGAIIFAGSVQSITREDNAMVITFHVTESFRGEIVGDTYTMHEWMGLWSHDHARLVTGEQGIYFLRQPSADGFSSLQQRFKILPDATVVLAPPAVALGNRSRRLRVDSTSTTMPIGGFTDALRRAVAQQR